MSRRIGALRVRGLGLSAAPLVIFTPLTNPADGRIRPRGVAHSPNNR